VEEEGDDEKGKGVEDEIFHFASLLSARETSRVWHARHAPHLLRRRRRLRERQFSLCEKKGFLFWEGESPEAKGGRRIEGDRERTCPSRPCPIALFFFPSLGKIEGKEEKAFLSLSTLLKQLFFHSF